MFSQPPGLNPPPFSALGVTHTAWSESTADPPFSFFCVLLDTDGDIIKSPFTIKMNRDASLYALGCEILRISSLDLATYQFTLWRPKTSIPAIQTELPERLKSLKPIENGGETEGLNIAMTVDQFCAAYQPGQLDIHILVLLHHIIIPPLGAYDRTVTLDRRNIRSCPLDAAKFYPTRRQQPAYS
ncbi:hypothetical protein BC834DRAFT_886497 [Gloeopeniophorella convolvens]|nr:hypothetical protein BC834DRAFT_886497 [Gloeopeniophorella convolvens]